MTEHNSWVEWTITMCRRWVDAEPLVSSSAKSCASDRPVLAECESDLSEIKARIFSGLLSRRLEACRKELLPSGRGVERPTVPSASAEKLLYSLPMKNERGKPKHDPEPQPCFSPRPEPKDAPFWLDTDPSDSPVPSPSASPSPSPNPGNGNGPGSGGF